MDRIPLPQNAIAVVSAADSPAAMVGAWLLTKRSPRTRTGYAIDVGYRYADNGDGTYQLQRHAAGRGWLDFLDGLGLGLLDVDEAHILAWLDHLRRSGLAEVTVARRLAAVSSLYRYLVRRRVLVANPAEHVDRPEIDPDESSTSGPDRDQARALLEWSRRHGTPRDHALVAVLLFAGLRVSEAVTADVEHLGRDRGVRTLQVVRKRGKVRRVVLSKTAWSALDRYLAGRTSGPLFLARDGDRLTRQRASQSVRDLAHRSNVSEDFTAHSLRHGFATLALDAGVSLSDLQDAMGHADPRTTRRYDRARNRLDRHPANKLEEFLAG